METDPLNKSDAPQTFAEVVTIGSELVLGQLVDTNAAYIARSLAEIGVGLAFHTTVGDDWDRMRIALRTALSRADIVIATGGLGPTEDDFTREVVAEVLDAPLELQPDLLAYIEGLFQKMGFRMAPNNRKQAYLPKGGHVIPNPRGTAPAFWAETNGRVLVALPGVPFETEPLLREAVLPMLQQRFAPAGGLMINRVLKVTGIGESNVDDQLRDIIRSSTNPIIGLQASPGEIKVRLTARAGSTEEAGRLLDQGEARIMAQVGPLVFGRDDETLAGNAARLVKASGYRLAVMDGLTRGRVAADLCPLLPEPLFRGGWILADPQSARDLADKALAELGADLALAVAGFPGEEGRIRTEIQVRTRDGRGAERILDLGGPPRIVGSRALTMTLFTLWSFLRDEQTAKTAGAPEAL